MKQFRKYIIITIVYFVLWLALVWAIGIHYSLNTSNSRIVFMNRMTAQIQETGNKDIADVAEDFSKRDVTDKIEVYSKNGVPSGVGGDNTYIRALKDEEGNTKGFVVFKYDEKLNYRFIILANISAWAGILPLIFFLIYVYFKILKPFQSFSEYPEKLSRGLTTEALPETKNRFFGKYVWGMNMLNDKLESDRKQIERLMFDRKQFISTLAHGIKTPVANIKLYSEAIETGLYRNGNPDTKDSEIAAKIGKNADEIAELVGSILNDPGSLRNSYEPQFTSFYLEDVKKRICGDFENRLKMTSIPFEVEMSGNPMVISDYEAIIRCLTQLMENAIKYGDGTGISLKLYRQDDITFFSVKNNGASLSEGELPYVFNCYFRGTNAAGKEGSGIGLYEAKSVAKILGGDMMMKVSDAQTEVILYVPDNVSK